MTTMGCPVDREEHTYVQKRDEAKRRTTNAVKQERFDTRAEQSALKELQKEVEGSTVATTRDISSMSFDPYDFTVLAPIHSIKGHASLSHFAQQKTKKKSKTKNKH
ncbi:hypothetical protein TNCV_4609381 [Trichonephila clavipes]|nr:hypothetical protein TNCV_4609381 [Trichonephila clavipes]